MRRDRYKLLVFVPVAAVILLFFFWPLLETFQLSMLDSHDQFIGLQRYAEFFSNPKFMDAFWLTLAVAAGTTVLSVVLAIIISLALRNTFVGKRISLFLYQTNISLPHIAVASMVVFVLGQKGLISAICCNMGLIDSWGDFPRLLEDVSPVGLLLSYTLKFVPFIGISVLSVLQSSSQDYEFQSSTLGVGKLRTFMHVTLPTIWPAILSTSIMAFTYAFGCYEVPTILIRKNVLSTLVYDYYYNIYNPDGIPMAYTGAIIIAVITIAMSALFLYLSSKRSDALE